MNVHKLTDHVLEGEADQDLVDALRDLLKRAEQGEINGLAWAGCSPNGDAFTGWQGAGGTMYAVGAAIMALQARYSMMMTEPEE